MTDEPPRRRAHGSSWPRSKQFAIGTQVGGYEIRGVLAQVASTQDLLAHDPGLARDVVIRVILRDAPKVIASARALAAFHHPGLPAIYGIGQHAGVDYLVLEHIQGVALAAHLAQRATGSGFSLPETLEVVVALCETLAVLHAAGLAHDDVRPETIVLAGGGRVVLLDSMRDHEDDLHAARLRDTYAVGLIAFELLTGVKPTEGEPIAAQLAARCTTLPEQLVAIVAEMVAEAPAARPRRIDLVGARLRALREDRGSAPLDVLIADDDGDVRVLLGAIVRSTAPNATVRFAGDGAEALRMIQREPPDVLLLDLQMPELTGLELLMYLTGTSLGEQITICVMSQFGETHRGLLHGLGVVDTFVKGQLGPEELAAAIAGILRRLSPVQVAPAVVVDAENVVGGRYSLGRPLGKGGMGSVFEVRHLQLSRKFALKILHQDFSVDPAARERFMQEARLASEMSHPNIVQVVDFGEDPRLGAYMVMDLVDGESLSPSQLSLRRACDVLGQIADAVALIHRHGIVHGDIKAENVMLVDEVVGTRRRRIARLLDFGLANRMSASADTSDSISGTPEYMAPERATGGPFTVGTDVYALGVLGFLLVTGNLPFTGEPEEVLRMHVEDPLPAIASARGETVDPALAALIARALHKDVAQRHPTMAAFRYELNAVMDMMELGQRRRSQPIPILKAPSVVVSIAGTECARGSTLETRADGIVVRVEPGVGSELHVIVERDR